MEAAVCNSVLRSEGDDEDEDEIPIREQFKMD
jgi:hypothetical protein